MRCFRWRTYAARNASGAPSLTPPQRIGRFAPSPTGPLHAGSLVAAMASWLDVRASGGRWLLRIEDLDKPREVPGAESDIIAALAAFGFRWDGAIVRQSDRHAVYQHAFGRLVDGGHVFPCGCSRREIELLPVPIDAVGGPAPYPGTCRNGLPAGRGPRAWRMRVPDAPIVFVDRAFGVVRQDTASTVGDFVVRRADGLWAYQLAVVVDDAEQGVTDVVRGADLLDSTPRQRLLQAALGHPHPTTLHVPLVASASGEKLSKSNGAAPLDPTRPLPLLHAAATHLALDIAPTDTLARFWERATAAWAARWPRP